MIVHIIGLLLAFVPAYLLGSIPTGFLVGKLAGIGDIRQTGSGNIGATNMVRAGGKKLGAVVLLLDIAKGAAGFYWSILVNVAYHMPLLDRHDVMHVRIDKPYVEWLLGALWLLAILGVFVGHMFTIWLKFRGGKGISIVIGSLLALPMTTLLPVAGYVPVAVFLVVWLSIYAITKTSSLAGLSATLVMPCFFLALTLFFPATAWTFDRCVPLYSVVTLLVFYRHHDNIRRLLRGEEMAFKKNQPSP
ncbi:MAG: glycerol-3-phosphate 1-O-acyltransferase PlsY [Rickettsiales bacterium]|nr:glycerol-3-phosphate 1-O-acyltransferase PlsY [Rickettsiales bacterium]